VTSEDQPDLNDLGLVDEPIPVDLADLPEQGGRPAIPPQPGTYRFWLPKTLPNVKEFWETYQTEKGQRLRAVFQGEHSLVMASGTQFRARISNGERPRGKEKKLASDMAFLLQALGHKGAVGVNSEYKAALQDHAGGEFLADVVYRGFCNPKKDRYVNGVKEAGAGCGQEYSMRGYKKADGKLVKKVPQSDTGAWPSEFTCVCGADVRAFAELENFKPAR
jgi:hypothetical protein